MKSIRAFVGVGIIIALFYVVYGLYFGYIHKIPLDGDSWEYHMPIALSILNGGFIHADFHNVPRIKNPIDGSIHQIVQWYYPGSSEAINAIFIFLRVPTFSNIFASIVLFFCLVKLASTFKLQRDYAILFGLTFVTHNIIFRWLNAVSIDVWVAVWFTLGIILLENPKKNIVYFLKLGFVLGMLIGSKYTTIYFLAIFFIFYAKNVTSYINMQRLLAFFAPFSVFGLFWYIRNYLVTGSPFYPVARFGFKGPLNFGNDTVWIETIKHPLDMINAGFGEYHMWIFSVLIAIAIIFYQYVVKRKFTLNAVNKLFLIGLLNFIWYFTFPTSKEPWIMVSSFRYSLPTFIPFMLGIFMLAAKYTKEELLGYFAIANMLNVVMMSYYPKLVFFYLPIGIVIIYFLNREKLEKEVKITKAK